jgi:hypothetical protein
VNILPPVAVRVGSFTTGFVLLLEGGWAGDIGIVEPWLEDVFSIERWWTGMGTPFIFSVQR